MILALTVTASGKSRLYGRFDQGVVMTLGSFTKVWFLNHLAWIRLWPAICVRIGLGFSQTRGILFGILLSVISSVVIMKCAKKLPEAAGMLRSLVFD